MKNSRLENFQKHFVSSLCQDDSYSSLLEDIIPPIRMELEKQALLIYETGYIARLTEALGASYETCWWVLGDKGFFQVCHDFILSQNSRDYNLSHYGQEFPEHLKNHSLCQEFPFLFKLAQFEWFFKEIFHKPNYKAISPETLSNLNAFADFKIKISPSALLFKADYNIYNLWKQKKENPEDKSLKHIEEQTNLLLYKKDCNIYIDEIEEDEFFMLESLKKGYSLGESLERAHTILLPERIHTIFKNMMHRSIITECKNHPCS